MRAPAATNLADPAAWIAAIGRERHRGCFVALFTGFAPRVRAYLLRHGVDEPMADELTQDVFVVIWRKAHLFDPERAGASAWIHTIARNLWIDAVRRNRRPDDGRIIAPPEGEPTPEEQLNSSENEARLRAALDSLPEHQAQVLRLSFFEEQTHPQIAERLGLPLGTVKSRIRLATGHLRGALQDLA
ncbi:sigma-70 family RNA polymerase sigma factor [Phenylobacterium sp.]|uniref:sigma-70 family RNA polymerase sigma factor n=1 Tax=Phenylobacterium sp. TaxID=1871053 RepID=UPI0035694527